MTKSLRSITNIKEHTDEELLGLTGIRALHPENEKSSTLQYGICIDDGKRFIIYIRSSSFRQYKVIIDFVNQIIINDLVIGQDKVKGVTLPCLRLQCTNAFKAGFKNIQLFAYRDDENPISWYGVSIPWVGYAVWGKFGFLMSETFRRNFFCTLMRNTGCSERLIHEIYGGTASADRAKDIWKDKGDSWDGKFELRQPGLSFSIINSL